MPPGFLPVAAFLAGQIAFTEISPKVDTMLSRSHATPPASLADVLAVDAETRAKAKEFAEAVLMFTPKSADQSAAIRKIREAVMTANAAIAISFSEHSANGTSTRRSSR